VPRAVTRSLGTTMILRSVLVLMILPALAWAQPKATSKPAPAPKDDASMMKRARAGQDLYATLKTNHGDIVVRLFPKDAPKTVENFVGLATGEKEWTHPVTREPQKKPLYDGVVFHRVIPNFMIQGGDPLGEGTGGPGYKFEDEVHSGRAFDKPGLLAMANAGPNTNGSQFFITVANTPHLTGRHTIFGEVISGYDVVQKVSELPTGPRNKPQAPVTIQTIEISAKEPQAATRAPAAK
jgi:peptidyl-prolyl cis-trans isomerase A (cyclophilin A)